MILEWPTHQRVCTISTIIQFLHSAMDTGSFHKADVQVGLTEVMVVVADGSDSLINVESFEFDDDTANIRALNIV